MDKTPNSLRVAGYSTLIHFFGFGSHTIQKVPSAHVEEFLDNTYGFGPKEQEKIIHFLNISNLVEKEYTFLKITHDGLLWVENEDNLITCSALACMLFIEGVGNNRSVGITEITDIIQNKHRLSSDQGKASLDIMIDKDWVQYIDQKVPSVVMTENGRIALDTPFLNPKMKTCAMAGVIHLSSINHDSHSVTMDYFINFLSTTFRLDSEDARNIVNYLIAYDYIDYDDEFVEDTNMGRIWVSK